MYGSTRNLLASALVVAVLGVWSGPLLAETTPTERLAAADPAVEDVDIAPGAGNVPVDEERFEKESPLRFKFDYKLVSDYVWRGFNLTEYNGEGTERPSHQVTFDLALDLTETAGSEANLGYLGARIWFQSYEGYLAQTRRANAALGGSGTSGDHLQQVDYTLYWGAEFDRAAEVEIGLVYRVWPRLESTALPAPLVQYNSDDERTTEIYAKVKFDDSELFGRETPLLSPFIFYALDIDQADDGSWIEIGVEHEFNTRDLDAFEDSTPLRHLTVTPSVVLGIDHRFLDTFGRFARRAHQKADRLGQLVYGLDFAYDLSGAVDMRPELGQVKIGAFIRFSDALREDLLNDELYGGFTVGYEW